MTDKELHKLGRRELLQLLLAQGREAEKAKAKLAEVQEEMSKLEEGYERLKERLNDKDAQILQLRESLQAQRQRQGFAPEEDFDMDFAQVRGRGQAAPLPPPVLQEAPRRQVYASPPPRPQQREEPPSPGRKPRHAQGQEMPLAPPPVRGGREQQAPRVLEVVQVVQGKLQPQSRMLLRPQRVEEGS
ncbi:MAG: hypothetical protein HFE88_03475 [Acutalibacter sp.]|nr:hypothetical protein [Acutalibacter sp.]